LRKAKGPSIHLKTLGISATGHTSGAINNLPELSEEWPGRRQRRDVGSAGGHAWHRKNRGRRRRKIKGRGNSGEKIDLFDALLRLGFFLARFTRADHFAQRTGVLAVECFGHGVLERTLAGVIDNHADPGDRLQQAPMKAQRHAQREDQQPFGYFRQHCRLEYQAGSELSTDPNQFNPPWKKSTSYLANRLLSLLMSVFCGTI
jgi:hypothetical protein